MSQRIFQSGSYEVQTGWNEPLGRYYLVVERDDDYVFSNLRLRDPEMDIQEILRVLEGLGIEYPEGLGYALAMDQITKTL